MFLLDLPPAAQSRVRTAARWATWRRGQHLMWQSGVHDAVYVIERGWVRVWVGMDGVERTVDVLGAGEIVGEMEMCEPDRPRMCWITALQEVRTLVVEGEVFTEMARRDPQLSWALFQTVTHRFRDENELRSEPDGSRRMALLLTRLADRYGERPASDGYTRIPIPLTRSMLAGWARISSDHARRVMRVLGRDAQFHPDALLVRRAALDRLRHE